MVMSPDVIQVGVLSSLLFNIFYYIKYKYIWKENVREMFAAVVQMLSHWLACNGPQFDPQQGRNFNFSLRMELGGMVWQNLSC